MKARADRSCTGRRYRLCSNYDQYRMEDKEVLRVGVVKRVGLNGHSFVRFTILPNKL